MAARLASKEGRGNVPKSAKILDLVTLLDASRIVKIHRRSAHRARRLLRSPYGPELEAQVGRFGPVAIKAPTIVAL